MKKSTVLSVVALLTIYATSFLGQLYGAYHGHRDTVEACECDGCHHTEKPKPTQSTSHDITEDACEVCALTHGLLDPKDLETAIAEGQGQFITSPPKDVLPRAGLCPPYVPDHYLRLRPLPPSHLHLMKSVIVRC